MTTEEERVNEACLAALKERVVWSAMDWFERTMINRALREESLRLACKRLLEMEQQIRDAKSRGETWAGSDDPR